MAKSETQWIRQGNQADAQKARRIERKQKRAPRVSWISSAKLQSSRSHFEVRRMYHGEDTHGSPSMYSFHYNVPSQVSFVRCVQYPTAFQLLPRSQIVGSLLSISSMTPRNIWTGTNLVNIVIEFLERGQALLSRIPHTSQSLQDRIIMFRSHADCPTWLRTRWYYRCRGRCSCGCGRDDIIGW